MIRLKIDIIQALTDEGFTQYQLRKLNLLTPSAIRTLTERKKILSTFPEDPELAADAPVSMPSLETINTVCILLGLKIDDVIDIIPTETEAANAYRMRQAVKNRPGPGRQKRQPS